MPTLPNKPWPPGEPRGPRKPAMGSWSRSACRRCLRVARRSAVKAKSQCINQIRAMLITGPVTLREQMRPLPTGQLLRALSRLRTGPDLSSPSTATKMALRSLARRHLTLTEELTELNTALTELATRAAPGLLAKTGVGIDVASQLLVTAGDNPQRLRSKPRSRT